MTTRAYTLLGWIVWRVGTYAAKIWARQNRAKVGAAGVVVLVLVAGLAAGKAAAGDDD